MYPSANAWKVAEGARNEIVEIAAAIPGSVLSPRLLAVHQVLSEH